MPGTTDRDLGRHAGLIDAYDPAFRDEARRLIATIGIPPDLAYLVDGLRRTRKLLSRNRAAFDELLSLGQSQWAGVGDLLDAIERMQSFVAQWPACVGVVAQVMESDQPLRRHPLHGHLNWCQYWGALFNEPRPDTAPAHRAAYAAISEQVLANVLALQARSRGQDVLRHYGEWAKAGQQPRPLGGPAESRVSQAAVQVRRLSEAAYAPVATLLGGEFETLGDRVAMAARRLAQDGPDMEARMQGLEVKPVLDAFRRLHEEVWGNARHREATRRRAWDRGHTGLPFGQIRLPGDRVLLATDELDDGSRLTRFYGLDMAAAHDRAEGAPLADEANLLAVSLEAGEVEGGLPPGYGLIKARHLTRAAVRSQTIPSSAVAALNPWHLKRLAAGLRELRKEGADFLWILLAMLATGRDPREVDFALDPAEVAEGQCGTREKLLFVPASACWRITVPPPAFAADRRATSDEKPTQPFLELPDHLGFAAALGAGGTRDALNNVARTQAAWERAEAWLRQLLWEPDARLLQVRAVLSRRLYELTGGDLATVLFVTGRSTAHARSVVHYSARDCSEILRLYRDALTPFFDTGKMARPRGRADARSAAQSRTHVGARRVPRTEAVARLVAGLRSAVATAAGPDRVNASTAYTQLGFHLGLAARPVGRRDLAVGRGDIGLVILSEKGSRYDQRVVALPPAIARQLELHAKLLARHGLRPTSDTGTFLYVASDGAVPEAFTPARLADVMRRHQFSLEPYALRRYARTRLLEMGVESEDIDAFMGHWGAFLSPHDPLSMYPVRRLRALAHGPVSELLAEVGYTPVQ